MNLHQSRQALTAFEQAYQAAPTRREDLKARYSPADEKRALARIDAAAARVPYVEASPAQSEVRAPARGVRRSLAVKEGAYLNVGEQIGLLADLLRARGGVFVDEPELGHVKLNDAASLAAPLARGKPDSPGRPRLRQSLVPFKELSRSGLAARCRREEVLRRDVDSGPGGIA